MNKINSQKYKKSQLYIIPAIQFITIIPNSLIAISIEGDHNPGDEPIGGDIIE